MAGWKAESTGVIEVEGHCIGADAPVFIIAEIGTGFRSVDEGRRLVLAAAEAGADAVKVQTYRAETVALPGATFTLEDGSQLSQYDFFKEGELSLEAHIALKELAGELGLVFFSTPGYYDDVELLDQVCVSLYKIGSDDLTNYPFLEFVARRGKPIILSTGMCELGEIDRAVKTVLDTGNDQLVLLHCLVGYPAPSEAANIRMIQTLRQAFGVPVGLSDHFRSAVPAILSVGLGAVAVEKHLSLDRSAGGPDNEVACEPGELKEYIEAIREAEAALGSGCKRIEESEIKWRTAARKSIVAAREIAPGEVIRREMVTIKRPSTGLHPQYLELVVGRRARTTISANQIIALEDLAGWDLER